MEFQLDYLIRNNFKVFYNTKKPEILTDTIDNLPK